MEPEGARYRATPQGKGLSPEIPVISEVAIPFHNGVVKANAVHLAVGSSLIADKRGYKTPTGSETVAWYQRDGIGTWESHNVSEKVWVAAMAGANKPEKDKAIRMALWQSLSEADSPLAKAKSIAPLCETPRPLDGIALKPSTFVKVLDGAKGLTEMRWDLGKQLPAIDMEFGCQQNSSP